jgi:hypothetical protein
MSSVFPLRFNNFIVKEKRLLYETWWNINVKSYEDDKWTYLKGQRVTHGEYVKDFYSTLKKKIVSSGYSIKDEKQFKNEIATFIYQLSSEK